MDVVLTDAARDGTTTAQDRDGWSRRTPDRYFDRGDGHGEGANIVLVWNQAGIDAIRQASIALDVEDPAYASRAMAMESVAVLDVLQAIHDQPGFLVSPEVPDDLSTEAAISSAAHGILSELYPGFKTAVDALLAESLRAVPDGAAEDAGVAFGLQVANAVIAARADDGADSIAYTELVAGHAPGEYRPTPPDFSRALQPNWGDVTPFTLESSEQFQPSGPPALTSDTYAAALAEVRRLGARDSEARTAEQTEIALFWSNDFGTSSEVGHWNQVSDQFLAEQGRSLQDNARLLAEVNVALADTYIAGWDAKYEESFWRPVTAIREAGHDGDWETAPDADWLPLLPATPNHPEYVSGHAFNGGAAARVLTDFFGPIPFSATSESLPGVVRSFDNFEQAAQEDAMSRIYAGVHFSFSTADGLVLGDQVATYALDVFQQRLDQPTNAVV